MKREAAWRRYLRFWGANPEADVDDEFRFHLETKIEELRALGLSPAEARGEALRQFGPVPAARAECIAVSRSLERRASRTEYLSGWYGDLRYAIRVLRKAKTSTAAAILILAVGIGATTSVFTLLDRMIYEPLPVAKPSQLVMLTHWFMDKGKSLGGMTFTYPGYVHLRDHQAVFSGLAAEATLSARERHAHEKIELPAGATIVSGNYFEVLGVQPFAGRAFAAPDDVRSAASHVAIASYRFASRRYLQPQDALGKTVYLRDIPFLIAGVMQPGFYGTQKGYDSDLYVPMGSLPELFPELQFDRGAYVRPIGRLRPDKDMVSARSNLQVLWDELPADARGLVETGPTRTEDRIECESGARGYAGTSNERARSLKLLGAIVTLLLLIGCANVACLLVARGVARQHETAIRLSLGAGRARILRQSFVESCVLALAGGAGALLIARWGSRLLLVAFHWQKRPIEIAPDARVLAFALMVSLLSAILFGLAPAVQLLRGGRVPLTQEHSVAPFASGKVLVSLEVGLSLILLAGAATFIRSLQNLRAVPTGFVAENVSVVRLHSNTDGDAPKPPLREATALADNLRGAHGVQSVTLSNFVIFNDAFVLRTVRSLGGAKPFSMHQLVVAPGYWDVLRIPILSGRGFTGRDDERAQRVAVLNQSMAERLFPNQNPLGKHILLGGAISPYKPGDDAEVVGIVKDTKFTSVSAPAPDLVYLPLLQEAVTNSAGVVLEARSSMDPAALGTVVRARIRDAHLSLTMQSATALNDEIGASLADDYIRMQASSIFGGLALALIASGLYGLMAYTVARRTREIGIRAALGASTLGIMVLVLRHSFRLIVVGIIIGIPGAVAVMRALSGIVFGLPPVDFASLGIGAALLLIAGAAASFVPAWRAAHLDPMQALRVQ